MKSSTSTLVSNILSGNKSASLAVFKDVMKSKMESAMKVRSVALTAEIFNKPAVSVKGN